MTWNGPLNKVDDFRFEIPSDYKGEKNNLKMRTSALIYASEDMISSIREDNAPEQTANTSSLPGIVGKALAMPDIHWGYGFPIGGVVAVDADDGVISPGGIGFDINCLHGSAMVLHEHGYRMKIEDFEKNWREDQIKCANFSREIKNTKINAFMKFNSKKKLLKTETESGREIVATSDHPFYTKEGMKKLENIDIGEDVAIHPFDGVNYSQPSDDIIVSIEDIKNLPLKKDMTQTIKELKKRGLLPLRQNNEKLSFLLKLFGYILGDGTIYFTKNKGTIWFYGNKDDLEEIREDVRRIGYKASRVYSRKRKHDIKTSYGNVKFERVEESIKTTSSSLAALLWALGCPIGNKCNGKFLLPNWIFNIKLWQKRLFLASYFGAELTSPSTVTNHGYNFYNPILSINKSDKILDNGNEFLNQIKELLYEFDVKSSIIRKREEYVNKDGKKSYRLRLLIKSDVNNLINLWSKIGYEYNKKRSYLANAAIHYLRLKSNILKKRKKIENAAKKLKEKGMKASEIIKKFESKYANRRFIERSIWSGRKTSSRIAYCFPKF